MERMVQYIRKKLLDSYFEELKKDYNKDSKEYELIQNIQNSVGKMRNG